MNNHKSLINIYIAIAALLIGGFGPIPGARAGVLGDLFGGHGADTRQTLDLKDFDSIRVDGVYELKVEVGSTFAVELKGGENDLKQVRVRVDGHTLVLDQRSNSWTGFHRHGVSATISMPALSNFTVTGVGEAQVDGISSEKFRAEISGVGDVRLSGTCHDLTARVSGIGDFDAAKLQCKFANVRVSGIGDASVYASDEADVSAGGIGDIDLYGSPAVVVKHGHMLSDISVH